MSISTAANLLAVLVAGDDAGRDLIKNQDLFLLGIVLLVGIIGVALGKYKPDIAVLCIGFIAGADATLWFYSIWNHFMTNVARQSERSAYVTGLILIVIGGFLGLWLIHKLA
ncbi:MAG: hypothetical protein M5U34_26020 [Chloroflexi bacterium]|nr:hypothetical protein [Chloroflexota bacterium]